MKKFFLTLAALVLLTLPTAAVTIQNQAYPGDTQSQAEMLKSLGVFQGTEKGFELGRAMRRDEAAAMLVRFLGAEDKVLAGNWKHPFTDVPTWADKYVGWLYQSGLTKGVSGKRYGAALNVTCDQYSTFLSRAATGNDAYGGVIADVSEVQACDKAGFTRGDAVALSARTLSTLYIQNGNNMSMAQFLIDKGVFTVEQLKSAAWDVLPRIYTTAPERIDGSAPQQKYMLACVIAGVPVIRSSETAVSPIYSEEPLNRVYGTRQEQGQILLYAIDPQTLAMDERKRYAADTRIDIIGKAGDCDYLLCGDTLVEIQGTAARTLDNIKPANNLSLVSGQDVHAFASEGSLCVIDGNGVRTIPRPEGERPFALLQDRIITEQITADRTVLNCIKSDGTVLDTYTIQNDYPSENMEARLSFAPALLKHNSVYLWGDAGLYQMKDGRLLQITARAAIDYGYDASDGSHVILTHGPGKRVQYAAKTGLIYNPAADEIVRICADGSEQLLLGDTPAHGLTFYKLARAANGEVRALHWNLVLEYAAEGGKIRVLPPSDTWNPEQYRGSIKAEQARLDALGAGAGA